MIGWEEEGIEEEGIEEERHEKEQREMNRNSDCARLTVEEMSLYPCASFIASLIHCLPDSSPPSPLLIGSSLPPNEIDRLGFYRHKNCVFLHDLPTCLPFSPNQKGWDDILWWWADESDGEVGILWYGR